MARVAGSLAACGVLVIGLSLAGCGDDGGSPAGDSTADDPDAAADEGDARDDEVEPVVIDTDPAEVTALDNTFVDQVVQVSAGTTVRWTNQGRQDHDIAPVEPDGWGVEPDEFGPGDVYEYSFDEPGTYEYYCTLHGTAERGMIGTVIVE
ncbi:MAG TPA: plastocyanin/azurin family copper-binding protein [Acidimicrobiales bacterium]